MTAALGLSRMKFIPCTKDANASSTVYEVSRVGRASLSLHFFVVFFFFVAQCSICFL